MRITMVEVGEVTKEKSYFYVPIKYTKDDKEESKKIYSFTADAYNAMKVAKAGEVYDVKLAKNKSGYWEWSEVAKAGAGDGKPAGSTALSTRGGSWETPEERARRQVMIVRQSSIAQAVALNPKATVEVILGVAGEFEAWVMRE